MNRPTIGFIFVLSVPYFAALASMAGLRIGGLQFTGFLWAVVLALGILLIFWYREPISFPYGIWLPWFIYVLFSPLWGGFHSRASLQFPLQMLTPLVVGMVASISIRTMDEVEKLRRAFVYCLVFITGVFLFFLYGPGASVQVTDQNGYAVRVAGETVCFIGCLFVARMHQQSLMSFLGWSLCLIVNAFSGGRTGTFILLLLWAVYPLYLRWGTRLLLLAGMCLLTLGLFYTPIFQERFFPADQGFESGHGNLKNLMEGNFSGAGRFEMWPVLWKKAQENLLFGAGAGEAGNYAQRVHLSNPMTLNDYLRIVFEFGIFGLILYLTAVLMQMFHLHKIMRLEAQGNKWVIGASFLGFFALLVYPMTENLTLYVVNFMNPLFALTGAAYGLHFYRKS